MSSLLFTPNHTKYSQEDQHNDDDDHQHGDQDTHNAHGQLPGTLLQVERDTPGKDVNGCI